MSTNVRQAILTKYHAPTERRDARISATSGSGHHRVYVEIPDNVHADHEDAHRLAAVTLCKKLDWPAELLVCGGLRNGYVFVATRLPDAERDPASPGGVVMNVPQSIENPSCDGSGPHSGPIVRRVPHFEGSDGASILCAQCFYFNDPGRTDKPWDAFPIYRNNEQGGTPMRAHLVINCENAAFGDTREEAASEVLSILGRLCRRLRDNSSYGRTYETLRDSNGNDVGRFCLKGEDDPGYADLLPATDPRRTA